MSLSGTTVTVECTAYIYTYIVLKYLHDLIHSNGFKSSIDERNAMNYYNAI